MEKAHSLGCAGAVRPCAGAASWGIAAVAVLVCFSPRAHGDVLALARTAAPIVLAIPPVNDDCEDASIATDGPTPFTTIDATTDGEPDVVCTEFGSLQVASDVWFKYLAECTGTVTVNLCDSDYDAKLAVYDGCDVCLPPDSPLDCDDDSCELQDGNDFGSRVIAPVIGRECYMIRVGGFIKGNTGTGTMMVTCEELPPPTGACCDNGVCLGTTTELDCTAQDGTWFEGADCDTFTCPVSPPPNDECIACIPVFADTPMSGTTLGAGGNDISSCGINDTRDAWHCWISDCTGTATFSLCDPDPALTTPMLDPTLAVFDACGGNELACDDDGCGLKSEITMEVEAATFYFIRISGHEGSSGDYTLNVGDCTGSPVLGACCFFSAVIMNDFCAPATQSQCDGVDGTWFGAGSACLGDNDGSGVDDLCESDAFFWLDYNDDDPDGFLPDFDQNSDFDNEDGDVDPTTGVDPFYNGPAAVADSLWWLSDRFPGRGIVQPATDPSDVIQDLAQRMATNGQTTSPNGHTPPFDGTFVDDMQSGLLDYINTNDLTGVIVSRSLAEPAFDTVVDETLLNRNVTLLLGFYRIESAIPAGGSITLVNWRRTGGQYATVAGVNATDGQVGLTDPDADAAEESGDGEVRGPDHDHDADGNPATNLPFRDVDYDHERHQTDKALASHDAYDAMPSFTPKSTGQWVLTVVGDPLTYGTEQAPFHLGDGGGAFDLVSSSIVDDAFLIANGYPDPAVGQIYTVVETAVILGRFGDSDGDGLLTLGDYGDLTDCMAGPDVPPEPDQPTTPEECLATFDADADGDVDQIDASLFFNEFQGP